MHGSLPCVRVLSALAWLMHSISIRVRPFLDLFILQIETQHSILKFYQDGTVTWREGAMPSFAMMVPGFEFWSTPSLIISLASLFMFFQSSCFLKHCFQAILTSSCQRWPRSRQRGREWWPISHRQRSRRCRVHKELTGYISVLLGL